MTAVSGLICLMRLEDIEAAHVRQADVADDDFVAVARGVLDRLQAVARAVAYVASLGEAPLHEEGYRLLVVDNQDFRKLGRLHCRVGAVLYRAGVRDGPRRRREKPLRRTICVL